jgi:hypothetical protein
MLRNPAEIFLRESKVTVQLATRGGLVAKNEILVMKAEKDSQKYLLYYEMSSCYFANQPFLCIP